MVTSAGTSATFASSVKSRMPSRRAVIDASISVASTRPRLWSGAPAALASAIARRPAGSTTGAELFEALRRARRDIKDLRISLAARSGAQQVSGREERRFGECHESPRS
jgi:hypothetical protein